MSISKKVFAAFALMVLFFWVVNFTIQKSIILPSFTSIEHENAKINIVRLEEYLSSQIDAIERLTYDWSAWDDTYDFIESRSGDYIDSNLPSDTFSNFDTDIVLILRNDGGLVWGNVYRFSDEEEIEILTSPERISSLQDIFVPMLQAIDESAHPDEQLVSGILPLEDRPVVYAGRTILTSESEGPSRGYFVLARTFDESFLEKMMEDLRVTFSISMISDKQSVSNYGKQYQIYQINNELLKISKNYFSNDIPVFTLSTHFPRDITRSGQDSLNLAFFILLALSLMCMLILALILQGNVFKPLSLLKERIQEVSHSKDYSLRSDIKGEDEIGVIAKEFDNMLAIIESNHEQLENNYHQTMEDNKKIQRVETDLRKSNLKLEEMARTDALTGIDNRLSLEDKLHSEWNSLRRNQSYLSLLMVDIDHFKLFNDFYGHQTGDDCLKQVAQILDASLRRSVDMVARFGGEEFVVVLPGVDMDFAIIVAENIQKSIQGASIYHGADGAGDHLTLSIGIASDIPSADSSVEQLLKSADQALYRAKEKGRNRIERS